MAAHVSAAAGAPVTGEVLEDLTRDSLRVLLPSTAIVIWVWVSAALLTVEGRAAHAMGVLALTLGVNVASYLLQRRRLGLAVGLYLAGLTANVTLIALAFPAVAMLYLYIPVLLITATLTSPAATWGMALLDATLALIVGRVGQGAPWGALASPLIFTLLTALSSWLSSRRLITALGWALAMTAEAQKNAEEARRRRAEVRSILKSLEEAYVRLERANQAMIFAREAAEKAYRFKAEFVANVSHELRTPLNLIVGFSEMMAMSPESYKGTPLPSAYRGDVMAIYRSARHLSDLINDVLDLSQIEAGRLPLAREPADLGAIIHEAAEIVRGLAQAKGLRLEVDLPEALPLLRLDRTRMRQVLLNLLTNATRFTDAGWIRVHARVEGPEMRIKVEDSGRGIAQDRISRAFEAFGQLDDQHTREGSGLGLAVSRRFVELHGGTMWIESTLGHGTRVGFSLPLPESGRETLPALHRTAPAQAPTQEKPRVLVLHDDARAVALLQRHIEGYQFTLAGSGPEAAAALRSGEAAGVIVDAGMAAQAPPLEEELWLPDGAPVLACPLPSLRRLGRRLGGLDFLPKPLSREDLLAALARLPGPPRKVLVVDDELEVIRLLARMLEAAYPGVVVLEAANGREGLEAVRAEHPDVVLLDLLMPAMDGHALLAAVAQDPELAATPVIIMSAHGYEEAARLEGEVSLKRGGGFTVTEVVQLVQALLDTTGCFQPVPAECSRTGRFCGTAQE